MALENKRVGENIKRRREELNYTQQSVADKVGVTKQAVCKIEKSLHAFCVSSLHDR